MSQEQTKILQLLEEGKINADQATTLLKAVQHTQGPPATPASEPKPAGNAEPAQGFDWGEWFKTLLKGIVKEQAEEHGDWQLERGALNAIAVQTVNGSLHYIGADQTTIAIHAHKRVKAPDLATAEALLRQVQVRIEEQEGTLVIQPDYPKPPPQVEVLVNLVIHGPRTLNLTGHSTNGAVQISGVEGHVDAHSTNGEVQVHELAGAIHAKSTNGNVNVQVLNLTASSEFVTQNGALSIQIQQGQAPITATTVNGSLHLGLPAAYSGQLDAKTQNGHIHSDLPVRATQQARNRLVGQLGPGGDTPLRLRSQNGSVTLALAA